MSGYKRSHEDGGSDKRSRPRDWREAFLGDDEPRRDSRDRDRDRERGKDRYDDRHGERSHGRRDEHRGSSRYEDRRGGVRDRPGYDRDGDHRRGESRYRDGERDRDGHRHHGDPRDRRPGNRDRRPSVSEKEEGEIDPSPPKPLAHLPSSLSPRHTNANNQSFQAQPRGFQPVQVPTGPRSHAFQTRPLSSTNALEPESEVREKEKTKEEEPVIVLEEERDPEKVLEERRRKREEIMAKFKTNGAKPAAATPVPANVSMGTGTDSVNSGGLGTAEKGGILTGTTTGATGLLKALGTKSSVFLTPDTSAPTPTNLREPSLANTPMGHDFDLTKHVETAGDAVIPSEIRGEGAAISAADYDPTRDKKDDEEKRRKDAEAGEDVAEPAKQEPVPVEDEYEEVEIEEDDEDDDVDMFAAFGDEDQPKKKRKVMVRRKKNGGGEEQLAKPKVASVLDVVDNVDDTDGYYRITPGEILDDGRYQVTISLGKGMFSGVVKAKVLKAVDQERRQDVVGKEVAIKVIRSQESMYVAGRKEAQILRKLNDADPEDKKHIVRMERQFEHRGHLCIVTESLSMNLRDLIKRFGKDVGLNMRAVRAYAHQMLLALSLMRKCNIVHADIKPDNILVTENKATLKVCDLGSAADVSEGEITPYLVSRFYRAPEIILGLPYDTAIDVWSVACTLYELYTGKILFPGRSNNHMLYLMMEVKGKLNHRMIKKSSLGEMHFDETMNFLSVEKDKITGQDVLKTLVLSKPTRDMRTRLLPPSSVQLKMKDDELKQLHHFIDLLEKCLHLDPSKRLTPLEALKHPFVAGQ